MPIKTRYSRNHDKTAAINMIDAFNRVYILHAFAIDQTRGREALTGEFPRPPFDPSKEVFGGSTRLGTQLRNDRDR